MILTALAGFPEVLPGDDLASLTIAALAANDVQLADGDVLAFAQKVVSKAEGQFVELTDVTPSPQADELAAKTLKDPALIELILRESTQVVRAVPHVLIVRHRLGFVVANAGIDQSNIEGGGTRALLLPVDPDASAAAIRGAIKQRLGVDVAVLINDSFGRPWRMGVCGAGIGAAGLTALLDERGRTVRFGRTLQVTQIAVADELAAAASLVMGQADEGTPVVVIQGLSPRFLGDGKARDVVRALGEDLFQ